MSLRSSSTVLVCTQVSITYVWQGLHRPKDTKDSTLFVTFTSHSHLLEHTLTLLHTQTYKPQTLTPSVTEKPLAAKDSRQRCHSALSLWTHSHSSSHPNVQTPNPHSIGGKKPIGGKRLSLTTSHCLALRSVF